jgi:hypothetical protein
MISVHSLAFSLALAGPPQTDSSGGKAPSACVALLLPSVEGVDGDATAVALSVRSIFQSYLTGPSLQSIPLDARLVSQATEEARQKDCTTMLSVTVRRKANSGGGNKLGAIASAAGTTAAYIPLPSYGAAIAVGAARGGAEAVASVAHTTHVKDEMTMTYKVTSADGTTLVPEKSQSAKAKSEGEDLLTPLIARASEVVAAAAAVKK